MESIEPPAHAYHVVDAGGEAFIWQPRPNVVVERASGILTLPLAHCFTDFCEPILRPGGQCNAFVDIERLTQYTRDAREHLSAFVLRQLSAFNMLHFLISSKFIALGLSSFKEEVGDVCVNVYSDRSSFLNSFADAMSASPA